MVHNGLPTSAQFLYGGMPCTEICAPEDLPAEAAALTDAATRFIAGQVKPLADAGWPGGPLTMATLLRDAGKLGLLGVDIPEQWNGLGIAKSISAAITVATAAEPSFSVSCSVHSTVSVLPILYYGTTAQKSEYLPALASGSLLGAYALTEAQAGTDAMACRARAEPDGAGGYRITGEKMWITNAAFATLFVVFARAAQGITAFLVKQPSPGLSIGREEHKLGLKGSSTCRILLDNVSVNAQHVVGAVGAGARVALNTLNIGRFKIAAGAVGQATTLLQLGADYSSERKAFGVPINTFGLIRAKLAFGTAALYGAQSALFRVAGMLDAACADDTCLQDVPAYSASETSAIECALLKVLCTETLAVIADETLQIFGAYGYTDEFAVGRHWCDARVTRIFEGTNEINRLNITHLLSRRIAMGKCAPIPDGSMDTDTLESTGRTVFWMLYNAWSRQAEDGSGRQLLAGAAADAAGCVLLLESAKARSRFGDGAKGELRSAAVLLLESEACHSLIRCNGLLQPSNHSRDVLATLMQFVRATAGSQAEAVDQLATAVAARRGFPF